MRLNGAYEVAQFVVGVLLPCPFTRSSEQWRTVGLSYFSSNLIMVRDECNWYNSTKGTTLGRVLLFIIIISNTVTWVRLEWNSSAKYRRSTGQIRFFLPITFIIQVVKKQLILTHFQCCTCAPVSPYADYHPLVSPTQVFCTRDDARSSWVGFFSVYVTSFFECWVSCIIGIVSNSSLQVK